MIPTKALFQEKSWKVLVLNWASQLPNLNPRENFWWDLKKQSQHANPRTLGASREGVESFQTVLGIKNGILCGIRRNPTVFICIKQWNQWQFAAVSED